MNNLQTYTTISLWLVISVTLYCLIGYGIERTESYVLIASWLTLFAGYFYILSKSWKLHNVKLLFVVSIAFRLLFLFSVPALSDDFFRFLWDGQLLSSGINPFQYLPSEFPEINPQVYNHLNSQDYYSVYPPIMQFVFGLAYKLASGDMFAALIIMRTTIIVSEIGTLYFIFKMLVHSRIKVEKLLVYALNPLVVIELTGNLHFEAIMIFFIVLSIYLLQRNKIVPSATSFGFAVCTKLLPLILLPLLFKYLKVKRGLVYSLVVMLVSVLLFLPFLNQHIAANIFNSIELYFQHFEFNASLYYLVRKIGYWITGYNIIAVAGKVLPVVFVATSIFIISKYRVSVLNRYYSTALLLLFTYYLYSLVVHPWYISLLVLFAVFENKYYPLVWSALIGMTYITYKHIPYKENMLLVLVEYSIVVICAVYEYRKQKQLPDIKTGTTNFSV